MEDVDLGHGKLSKLFSESRAGAGTAEEAQLTLNP